MNRDHHINFSESSDLSDSGAESPLISILINNHNYETFLHEAIESALNQTYAHTEVIVVDDGSTDGSRNIIRQFGDRIRPVLKENGGQASTFNAGVSMSRGDILCFLDADDLCRSNRAERLVELFRRLPMDHPVMVNHRLEHFGGPEAITTITPSHYLNLDGRRLEGDFLRISDPDLAYEHAQRLAYLPFLASPTSGIALNRSLLDKIFPIPETHEVGADCLVVRAAMLAGEVYGTYEVLGDRRFHENNHSRERQKHLVDEAFLSSMNDYLNRILQAEGRRSVISVFDSIGATRYYEFHGSIRNLLRLAFLVPRRCLCWQTLKFSILAIWCATCTALSHRRRGDRRASTSSGAESLR